VAELTQNMTGSAATHVVSSLESNITSASYQKSGGPSTSPRQTSAKPSISPDTSTVECLKETTVQRGVASNEQSNPRLNTSQDTPTVKNSREGDGSDVSQKVKSGFE
jgi:hypothetical protein